MIFSQKEIYEKVKEQFRQRGFDVEFGSNIQQIQNSMQYLVSMLNQNTQINVKETILSSQTKRNMILEDARLLGYEAIPKRSYEYSLTMTIHNNSNIQKEFTLGLFDSFSSGGNTYYYVGDPIEVTIQPNSFEIIENIIVKEGTRISHTDNQELEYTIEYVYDQETNTNMVQDFLIVPYNNVEENGIFVSVFPIGSLDPLVSIPYTKQASMFQDVSTYSEHEFKRKDDINTNFPFIYFKYGNWGTPLEVNDRVVIDILLSKGQNGKGDMSNFKFDKSMADIDFIVSNVAIRRQGTDEETNESIKKNQPLFDNSYGRIVTIHDFVQFQSKQSSVVDQEIWDGYDEYEKIKGEIWFSFIPKTRTIQFSEESASKHWILDDIDTHENNFMSQSDWKLSDGSTDNLVGTSEVSKIFKELRKYTIPTLIFNFRQPVYLDFEIDVNMQQYNKQQPFIFQNNDIFEQVKKFFTEGDKRIEKFNSKFFNSDLIDFILKNTVSETMFDIALKTSFTLKPEHVQKDSGDYDQITVRLGQDFVSITDLTSIIYNNLPVISQTINGETLQMPMSIEFVLNSDPNKAKLLWVQPIKLNGVKQGEYRVFGQSTSVEIMLDVTNQDVQSELNSGIVVDVVFPTPNISVKKNLIPRLKSLKVNAS